jgi:GNAT superfamily N-acetyltransferase
MQEFTVRRAHVVDAQRLAEIQIAAWRSAYVGIMANEVLAELNLQRITVNMAKNLSDKTNPISTFVAVSDSTDIPLGFGGVCSPRNGPEVLDQLPKSASLGELAFLNFHPDAFGTGAASVLFRSLENELRALGYTKAYLMVAEGNIRAMRFYAKHGWRRTSITHAFDRVEPAIPERVYYTNL